MHSFPTWPLSSFPGNHPCATVVTFLKKNMYINYMFIYWERPTKEITLTHWNNHLATNVHQFHYGLILSFKSQNFEGIYITKKSKESQKKKVPPLVIKPYPPPPPSSLGAIGFFLRLLLPGNLFIHWWRASSQNHFSANVIYLSFNVFYITYWD